MRFRRVLLDECSLRSTCNKDASHNSRLGREKCGQSTQEARHNYLGILSFLYGDPPLLVYLGGAPENRRLSCENTNGVIKEQFRKEVARVPFSRKGL